MQMRLIFPAALALFPTLALSEGGAVTDLVTRYSAIKICGIYDWVSTDPTSEAMLDALDLKIRAQKALLDPDIFSSALRESQEIMNERTDTGQNGAVFAAENCEAILDEEATAFRAER